MRHLKIVRLVRFRRWKRGRNCSLRFRIQSYANSARLFLDRFALFHQLPELLAETLVSHHVLAVSGAVEKVKVRQKDRKRGDLTRSFWSFNLLLVCSTDHFVREKIKSLVRQPLIDICHSFEISQSSSSCDSQFVQAFEIQSDHYESVNEFTNEPQSFESKCKSSGRMPAVL